MPMTTILLSLDDLRAYVAIVDYDKIVQDNSQVFIRFIQIRQTLA